MASELSFKERVARMNAYMQAVHDEAKRVKEWNLDPAARAAYRELIEAGEYEAAQILFDEYGR